MPGCANKSIGDSTAPRPPDLSIVNTDSLIPLLASRKDGGLARLLVAVSFRITTRDYLDETRAEHGSG